MVDDDVLHRAKELLEHSAALERELKEFYQREAEQGHPVGQSMTEPSAALDLAEDEAHRLKTASTPQGTSRPCL